MKDIVLEYYSPDREVVTIEYYTKDQVELVFIRSVEWEKAKEGNYTVAIL